MTQRITGHGAPNTYLNLDDPAAKLLAEKLAYHEKQIDFHRKEAKAIERLLELMEKYDMTEHPPGTVANPNSIILDTTGPSIETLKNRAFWRERAVEYIKQVGVLVRTADVYSAVNAIISDQEKRAVMSILSLVMADLCSDGILKKYKVEGRKGLLFGTPEMFNGETPIVEF